MSDRLHEIFQSKRASTARFRGLQHSLGGFADRALIYRADPATREGTIELHKGIHWINLELVEYLHARPEEKPEELADVLHFIVELALLLGYDEMIVSTRDNTEDRLDRMLMASKDDVFVFADPDTNARFCVLAALRVADLLKNKPWKQTLKPPPDPEALLELVLAIFYWYGATVRTQGMSAQDLYDQFMRKEKINAERVATGV